jgi:hypothetical protein
MWPINHLYFLRHHNNKSKLFGGQGPTRDVTKCVWTFCPTNEGNPLTADEHGEVTSNVFSAGYLKVHELIVTGRRVLSNLRAERLAVVDRGKNIW